MRWSRSEVPLWRPTADPATVQSNDSVVQLVGWLLGLAQTLLNAPLYLWQAWIAAKVNRGRPWPYFNYVYQLEWALIVTVLLITSPAQLVVAICALWRTLEILIWYTKLLLDKSHKVMLEVERNLLFLLMDVLMFVTLLALLLQGRGVEGFSRDWAAGFSAFTLNGSPAGYDKTYARLVGILGTVGGLTLLGAGLGMLVGLVGQRIESGPGTEYSGPTRMPPPWRRGP
jgi:hypothetical protein